MAGESVTVLDTAGLRAATEEVERIGVAVATRAGERADLVLYVIDARTGVSDEDEEFLRRGRGEDALVVWAKADLLQSGAAPAPVGPSDAFTQPRTPPPTFKETVSSDVSMNLTISARTGSGLDALRAAIAARLGVVEAEGELLVLARHKEALDAAARLFAEAAALAADGRDAELVAERAREALVALGAITGETATEDLLDRIFSTFCVGK